MQQSLTAKEKVALIERCKLLLSDSPSATLSREDLRILLASFMAHHGIIDLTSIGFVGYNMDRAH